MQENRRLGQEALRRVGFFDDYGRGHSFQMQLFFARELLSRVDDDGKIRSTVGLQFLDQFKAGHVRQFEIEHQAVKLFILQFAQGFRAGRHRSGCDVAVAD